MNDFSPMLREALVRAITHKWCLIPLDGKKPIESRWPETATSNPAELEALARRYPQANFGLVTGKKSGVVVLDVDVKHHGDETLAKLEAEHGKLPRTVIVRTGGGGQHYYFQCPDALLTNSTALLGPGLDFKAANGQVVMPVGIHPETKRAYEWELDHHPDDVSVAPMPSWLLQLLTVPASKKRFVCPPVIPESTREKTLFKVVRSLRCDGKLDDEEIAELVRRRNARRCKPPLDERELEKTIAYALQYADRPDFNGQAYEARSEEPVSGDWPDPQPVQAELLPVEPLPANLIPDAVREWNVDVATRMQCPLDFVAAATIVEAGSMIGAACGIRPKKHDDWTIIPNVWGGVVARPSMLKTPAIHEALKPLEALERTAKEQYDTAMKSHAVELEGFKAQKEALQSKMRGVTRGTAKPGVDMASVKAEFVGLKEPELPIWRRYKTNDSTIEKMAELLGDNPNGLLLTRDELVGLFASWDRDNREADRYFYLESWNGFSSYTTDRIERGTLYCPTLCVSLFGGIQPNKLIRYLHEAMRGFNNDGLVQRLQVMVYPDEPKNWQLVDTPVNSKAKCRAHDVIARLASLDVRQCGAYGEEGQRPYFRFDDGGQAVFYEWLDALETKVRHETDEEVLQEHLGKYRKLMPSLALIFHLLQVADQGSQVPRQVTQDDAERAAAWCAYLESHARRIYGMVTNIGRQAAVRLAGKLTQKLLPDTFTIRDVYRRHWSLLEERSVAERAIQELISLGWLREKVTPGAPGQRGKVEYITNPKVKGSDHG